MEGAVSPSRRPIVSKRAAWAAVGLLGAHVIAQAYVVSRHVLYDQGGFEGLLWWLVAFFVLPVFAALTLATSVIAQWLQHKKISGE